MSSHTDTLLHPVKNKAQTVAEPYQLTLWPDDALPGQMPLFNRKAEVGRLSEAAAQYCEHCEPVLVRHFPGHLCFHCEDLIAEYLANRHVLSPPAAEPIWKPRFGKRPPLDVVPAAIAYL